MKKLLSLLLCFSIIFAGFVFPATALDIETNKDDQDFDITDILGKEIRLTFEIVGEEAVLVDCDEDLGGELIIPATYKGLPVTSIGRRAFRACTEITEIVIPDTVKTIGEEAFAGCASLTNVYIPEGVTAMGLGAFVVCEALEEITLPDSLTVISEYAFLECNALKSVTLGANVTEIKKDAFDGCISLAEINIPASVTSIGEYAFWECPIEYLAISNNVETIGERAFFKAKIGTLRFYSLAQKEKFEAFFTADEVICLCEAEHTFTSEADVTCNVCLYKEDVIAPVLAEKSYSYIKLNAVDGYEYSVDGKDFQDSNVFEGLYIGKEYTVYQRVKSNGSEEASEISDVLYVTTDGFETFYVDGVMVDGLKIAESVEDKQTYKVTVKYTATADTGIAFMTASSDSVYSNSGYVEAANFAVKRTGITEIETEADIYFTVDMFSDKGNPQGNALYLYIPDGAENIELAILSIEQVNNVNDGALIGNGGAAILINQPADATQALRFYFTYDTVTGSEVVIDSTEYKLVSRGFLLANGEVARDAVVTREMAKGKSDFSIVDINVENFDKCWETVKNADGRTNNLTFSIHVIGFEPSEKNSYNNTRRLYVKGYVVIDVDGTEYTLYSAESSFTVSEVAAQYNLQ